MSLKGGSEASTISTEGLFRTPDTSASNGNYHCVTDSPFPGRAVFLPDLPVHLLSLRQIPVQLHDEVSRFSTGYLVSLRLKVVVLVAPTLLLLCAATCSFSLPDCYSS